MSGHLMLGQRVIALKDTGVCDAGETGIVYEIYPRTGWDKDDPGPGVSVIFEGGRYDGFSPAEQRMMLKGTEQFCEYARRYRFTNVGALRTHYDAGLFTFEDAPVEGGG